MSSVLLKDSTLIPRGVGHSLICPRRACTAKQVMVFRVFSPVNKAYNFNIWRLQSCVARRPLCHKVNLPRCEARRHLFIKRTFQVYVIHSEKLYINSPQTLKLTHSTKLLHLLRRTIRYNQPSRLFTVLYFSVRSSRSNALCYGLPSCMSVKTTQGAGAVWEEARKIEGL